MKKTTTDPLLTSSEAATLLDCHESTIKRLCDSGLLSFQRTPGGHRRIPLDSLLAFAGESGQPLTLPLFDMGEHAATFWHAWQAFRASETTLLVDLMEQWLLSHALDLIAPTMRLLAQQEQIELADVFDDLIRPLMARIGDRWAAGRLTVAQEHLYSHAIEQGLFILAEARRRLDAAHESVVRKRALVACAEGNDHTMGAMCVKLLLEDAGFDVLYLGANLPTVELPLLIRGARSALLCLAHSPAHAPEAVLRHARLVNRLCDDPTTVVVHGGASFAGLAAAETEHLRCFDDLTSFRLWIAHAFPAGSER